MLWFIIGAIVGFIVAWYFQGRKCASELAARDRDITRLTADLSAAKAAQKEIVSAKPEPQSLLPTSEPTRSPDDLTRINGIGPVIKKKLNDLGVETFAEIAAFKKADIDRVNGQLNFKGRIERENWVNQAKKLAKGG